MTRLAKNKFAPASTSDDASVAAPCADATDMLSESVALTDDSWRKNLAPVLLAILFSILLLVTILLSAVDATVCQGTGWFQKEYEKYSVLEDVRGEMSMESALQVTDEMMKYLCGERDNLVVMTTLDGRQQEFFSQREKDHLRDCRGLFIGGFRIRNGCGIAALLVLIIALLSGRKHRGNGLIFTRTVPGALVLIVLMLVTLGLIVARNFSRYFEMFHRALFDNELWILDPSEDNLINLLPEGFFVDSAGHILVLSLGLTLIVSAIFFLVSYVMARTVKAGV